MVAYFFILLNKREGIYFYRIIGSFFFRAEKICNFIYFLLLVK